MTFFESVRDVRLDWAPDEVIRNRILADNLAKRHGYP
jgi:hypothetical protein